MKESVMEDALATQWRCPDSGITRPFRSRREILTRLELAPIRWKGELLEALRADLNRSPYGGYMSELDPTLAELRFTRRHLKKWARSVRHPAPLFQLSSVGTVHREPYDVSLILTPWNYPLLLTLAPLMSAIMTGCTATMKPGEDTPAPARAPAEVLRRVFPPKYITVAEGGREEAETLADRPSDIIFFTGSPAVGKKVMATVTEHLTPVTPGLGGRSPVTLALDVDVEPAVARIAWGKSLNAGQTCVAPGHVWVPEGMARPFVVALAREITHFCGENPLVGEKLPRIVNRRHFDHLAGLLSGGRIAVGGQTDPESLCIAPTVLVDVPEGSPMLEEEIFSPTLPVLLYRNLPELVKAQRQKPRPLTPYPLTRSCSVERAVLEALPFGGRCVNDTMVHLADPRLPFSGVRNSGMGACYDKAGFDTFTHEKSVLKKGWLGIPVRYPPYGKKHLGILRKLTQREKGTNMVKLYFRYGVVGSSKTANTLMVHYNYEERGQDVLLVGPAVGQRDGARSVASRVGLSHPCICFSDLMEMTPRQLKPHARIIVDETQFLTRDEVCYLTGLVNGWNIPVICYGLCTDFKGELFLGSTELLATADVIEEVKTTCWYGKKALCNAHFDESGHVIKESEQMVLGTNDKYIDLCRKHWKEGNLGP